MIDIGTSSLRAGYAGDDAPKAIIPTAYGYHPALPDNDVNMSDAVEGSAPDKPKYRNIYIGQSGPSVWREGMEIANPVVEGLSTHFDIKFTHIVRLMQFYSPGLPSYKTFDRPCPYKGHAGRFI